MDNPAIIPTQKKTRRAIGCGLRFSILKRDRFQCAYCGRKPPEVALEVDHIIAVANGGSNEPENLISACRDCNAGKRIDFVDVFEGSIIPTDRVMESAAIAQRIAERLPFHTALKKEWAIDREAAARKFLHMISDRTTGLVQPHAPIQHLPAGSLESGYSIGLEPKPLGESPTPEHSSGECSQKTEARSLSATTITG